MGVLTEADGVSFLLEWDLFMDEEVATVLCDEMAAVPVD